MSEILEGVVVVIRDKFRGKNGHRGLVPQEGGSKAVPRVQDGSRTGAGWAQGKVGTRGERSEKRDSNNSRIYSL